MRLNKKKRYSPPKCFATHYVCSVFHVFLLLVHFRPPSSTSSSSSSIFLLSVALASIIPPKMRVHRSASTTSEARLSRRSSARVKRAVRSFSRATRDRPILDNWETLLNSSSFSTSHQPDSSPSPPPRSKHHHRRRRRSAHLLHLAASGALRCGAAWASWGAFMAPATPR